MYSPHTRGCSLNNAHHLCDFVVFLACAGMILGRRDGDTPVRVLPAYAGVLPLSSIPNCTMICVPHIRGGDPQVTAIAGDDGWCSPHTRGCFWLRRRMESRCYVRLAQAE